MTAWIRGVCINGAITGTSTALLLWLIGVQTGGAVRVLRVPGRVRAQHRSGGHVAAGVVSSPPAQGAGTFGLALAAILFVQQVETALLVPLIMGKELDLHPVELFFWTLAAGTLFGLVGALLAVPIAALVRILVDEFYLRPRRLDTSAITAAAGRLAAGETDVAK